MYSWKKRNKKLPLLLGGIIFATILVLVLSKPVGILEIARNETSTEAIPDLSIVGYVKVEPNAAVVGDVGVVSLTGDCYQMTANTEATQAESILNGMDKKISLRPLTHDLVKDIFENLEIKVIMIKITDIRNSTFYGRLILQSGNKIVNLDSRPSDGIAIAVRTDAPIYVKGDLLKQQGKYIC